MSGSTPTWLSSRRGGIHWLTSDELEQLRTIYEEFQTTTTSALTKKLA